MVEESLWKWNPDDERGRYHWMLVGHHEPGPHRYLRHNHDGATGSDAAVVLGIGGKPDLLLNVDHVQRDNVPVLRRFSGGGTVVLDHNSIWTTIIGRRNDDEEGSISPTIIPVDPYPRPIMEWSMKLFGPAVDALGRRIPETQTARPTEADSGRQLRHRRTMVLDNKSCGTENTGRVVTLPPASSGKDDSVLESSSLSSSLPPTLALRENDYVLGTRKVAGNAQSIGKSGWLHHTSWLWDYDPDHMTYLRLPPKRPDYRKDRKHTDFLTTLQHTFPTASKADFYREVRTSAESHFVVEPVRLPEVLEWLYGTGATNMTDWASRCRTRVVDIRDLST